MAVVDMASPMAERRVGPARRSSSIWARSMAGLVSESLFIASPFARVDYSGSSGNRLRCELPHFTRFSDPCLNLEGGLSHASNIQRRLSDPGREHLQDWHR